MAYASEAFSEVLLPARLPRGFVLGDYVIDGWLRDGGMAAIYRAHRSTEDQRVAVKLQLPSTAHLPQICERFDHEADAMRRVSGAANVVELFDAGVLEDGRRYFVMEWIDGEDLEERLDFLRNQDQRLSIEDACRLGHEIALGLQVIHERRLVHRDLKPANVMLGRGSGEEVVKLVDFGIVAAIAARGPEGWRVDYGSEEVMGTSAYMAPEQAAGGEPHPTMDIYALGVLLYEVLTGTCVPPDGWTPESLPSIESHRRGVPAELSALVRSCMRTDAAQRPQRASEVARGLGGFVPGLLEGQGDEETSAVPVIGLVQDAVPETTAARTETSSGDQGSVASSVDDPSAHALGHAAAHEFVEQLLATPRSEDSAEPGPVRTGETVLMPRDQVNAFAPTPVQTGHTEVVDLGDGFDLARRDGTAGADDTATRTGRTEFVFIPPQLGAPGVEGSGGSASDEARVGASDESAREGEESRSSPRGGTATEAKELDSSDRGGGASDVPRVAKRDDSSAAARASEPGDRRDQSRPNAAGSVGPVVPTPDLDKPGVIDQIHPPFFARPPVYERGEPIPDASSSVGPPDQVDSNARVGPPFFARAPELRPGSTLGADWSVGRPAPYREPRAATVVVPPVDHTGGPSGRVALSSRTSSQEMPISEVDWEPRAPSRWRWWLVAVLVPVVAVGAWVGLRSLGEGADEGALVASASRTGDTVEVVPTSEPAGGAESSSESTDREALAEASAVPPMGPAHREVSERSGAARTSGTRSSERSSSRSAKKVDCNEQRTKAQSAKRKMNWATVLKATSRRRCWSGEWKLKRQKLRVQAYAETHNFSRCIKEGSGSSDKEIRERTKWCNKKLDLKQERVNL